MKVSAGIQTTDPWVMGWALYYWAIWLVDEWAKNKSTANTNVFVYISVVIMHVTKLIVSDFEQNAVEK